MIELDAYSEALTPAPETAAAAVSTSGACPRTLTSTALTADIRAAVRVLHCIVGSGSGGGAGATEQPGTLARQPLLTSWLLTPENELQFSMKQ